MNNRLFLSLVALLFAVSTMFIGCSSDGDPTVPVTGVELNHSEYTLYVGEPVELTAIVQPLDASNQNVSWSVDNEYVTLSITGSTVTVTGATAGTSTVTVTTQEGDSPLLQPSL